MTPFTDNPRRARLKVSLELIARALRFPEGHSIVASRPVSLAWDEHEVEFLITGPSLAVVPENELTPHVCGITIEQTTVTIAETKFEPCR